MENRLLVIGLVWPEPDSSAAGWRILQLIEIFQEQGFEIHFASAASKSEHSYPLEKLGIQKQSILLNDDSFDAYVRDLKPDYVMFDRFMVEEQYSWRIRENCPKAIHILDTEDLHFLRQARQDAFKKEMELDELSLYSDLAKREIASIYRSDLSIIISAYEMSLLTQQFHIPESLLVYLPLLNRDFIPGNELPSFEERKDFMFIGNFIHEPNWRTVLELKRIWPSIRKRLPQAELHIYGAYPSQKVWELNKPSSGFIIKGRAESALETMKNYRVLLAPIPFGAGQKGKFMDALATQTPIVTSRIGAEDMLIEGNWPGFIFEEDDEFVKRSIELYNQEDIWRSAQDRGQHLSELWKAKQDKKQLLNVLLPIKDNLEIHRARNFVGQILWSNQFAASKYMSLWIEAKNGKKSL